MSKTIDEKVVSMQFDNSHFEKNVQTSMSTLDKLKKSLNLSDSAKGLENISASAKKVDMSGLAGGVETVRAKFSAMEVVAVTALANITNSAVNAGKRIVSSLTIDQVTAGWTKYEQKTASVQTIMNATGKSISEVNGYLEKLMWYSDETSYGFTDMTQSLGQLTSAGGDIEKLIPMIEGIANATAFAGKGASEFSRAIYNLNQSYSAGYLQYMDWKSLDLAGVSSKQLKQVFIDTAKSLGKLDSEGRTAKGTLVELGNFGQTLQDQWADTSVMEAAFGKFAELTEAAYKAVQSGEYDTASEAIAALADQYDEISVKAFSSAQEAKSFTEAIEATKDAVSSGWMKSAELIFGNYEEAKKTWTELANSLWDIFASGAESRNDLLEGALNSKWDQLTQKIEEAGVSTEDFQDKLKETAREHGIAIDGLIKEYGSLASVISNGKLSKNVIIETLKKFVGIQKEVSDTTDNVTDKLETFQKVVNQVINGDFGNGADRVKALTEAGYEYATVQKLVNKIWERNGKTWSDCTISAEDLTEAIGDMSDSELKSIGYTDDQVKALRELAEQAEKTGTPINELISSLEKPSGRELLIDSFRNALTGLTKIINTVKKAWGEIFSFDSNDLYKIIETLHSFSEHLVISDENADKLRRTLKGLFAIIDIVATFTGGAIRTVLKVLAKLLGMVDVNVLDITASVGDAIVKFHDWLLENSKLAKIVEKLGSALIKGNAKVKGWIQAFLKLPLVQSTIEGVQKAFSALYKDLKEYLGEGTKRIGEFIERVKDLDSISLSDVSGILRDFKDSVVDYFLDVDGRFDGFMSVFDGLKTGVKKRIDQGVTQPLVGVGVTLDSIKAKVLSFFGEVGKKFNDNVGWGEIFTVILGGSLVLTVSRISKALKALSGPFKLFLDFGSAINGVLGNVSKALKAFTFSLKAKTLLSVALAIGVLAGSIALLTLLDQKKMWLAVGAVGVLAVGLLALSAAMGAVNKIGGITKCSTSLLAIAASLLILVIALKAMEGLDGNKVWNNVGVLGALAAGLLAMSLVLGKYAPQLSKGSIAMISVALALKIMVGVLKDLDSVEFGNLGRSIAIIAGAMIGLAAVAAICKGIGFKEAFSILAIVIALKVLVSAFNDIADLDLNKVESNIAAFVVIFGTFAALMTISKLAGANAAKAGLGILAMSAALILIVSAMKMLSKMSGEDLTQSLAAVSTLLLVFGAVVALSKYSGEHAKKAGVMLLMMSGALVILAGVIVVLSHVKPDGLARALGAVTALELVFGVLIVLTRYAGDAKKVMGTLIVLSVTLGIMAIALGSLAMIDSSNLASATGAIVAVTGMFGILVASTHFAKDALGTLIVLTVAVGMLGGLLYLLAGLPIESTVSAAASLSVLILSLSAAMLILSKTGNVSIKAIGAMAAMGLVIAELAVILGLMSYFDVAPSIETMIGMSALLMVMSGSCKLMSAIPVAAAAKAALSLVVFVGILGAFVAAIGALQANEILANGAETMGLIGYAIGNFVGNIIGGLGAGMSSGLPEIGSNLSGFMTNALPFFNSVKGISAESIEGVKILAETIRILTGASLLETLSSFFTGQSSLTVFGDQLAPFGEALRKYSESVSGLDTEAITNSAAAGQALANLANSLPKQDGWAQTILGSKDLSMFATQLTSFGESMRSYSESIAGLNVEAVTNSAAAGQALSDLANSLPKQDGWVQTILGSKDLGVFGSQLAAFGSGLQGYSQSITGLNTEAIIASVPAGQALSDLANSLPRQDGWAQTILGSADLSIFGSQLSSFGSGLSAYSQSIVGLNVEAIVASVAAGQALSDLANSLPKEDGWAQTIFGSKDLSTFGEKLSSFGASIAAYSESVTGINIDQIESATSAFKSIAKFAEDIADADLGGLGNLSDTLGEIGSDCVDNFVNAFKDAGANVTSACQGLIQKMTTALKSRHNAFNDAGKSLIIQLTNGLKSKTFLVSSTVATVVSLAASTIKNSYSSFYNAGSYLIDGFADGISENTWKAEAEAKAMAKAAEKAAKEALDINSPSKVFRRIGYSVPEGFAQGIDRMGRLVRGSAGSMANNALTSTKDAIARIGDMIGGDIDTQPTIRPILDLSDVASGAGTINRMLSTTPSVDVLSNVGTISSMMNMRQNGANDDVISAINDLGRKISESSGDTYSINGVTYDDGSNVSEAVRTLVRAARIERRT